MNVTCPQCSTIYRVDPAKVPPGGVRARCSACGGVIPVGLAAERSQTAAPFFAGVSASSTSPVVPTPSMRAPAYQDAPRRPSRPTPPRPAALPPLRPTPPTPWPPIPTGAPNTGFVQPPQPFMPLQTPVSVPAATPPSRVVPETAATVPLSPPATQHVAAPSAPSGMASSPTATSPMATSPMASSPQPFAEIPPTVPSPQQPAPGERRPVNPFLSRNPDLRAKRLARALVSDMVAYYPAKHSEGLQRGTLKELFRDEIKKSYDEYVAQVGADVARTTTHFQEALNEVLGAGKRIF